MLAFQVGSVWGQTSTGVSVTRTISAAFVLPSSQFKVTLHIQADRDLNGMGIEEKLPVGWVIHPLDNAGAAFKRAQGQWVFKRKIKAGDSIEIVYEVEVPGEKELRAGSLPACFSISGVLQSKVPALQIPVGGDSELQVVSIVPGLSAIAHLVPAGKDNPRDSLDFRLSQWISRRQFTRAIELWRSDTPIPGTGGETIDLDLIEKIFAYYETCTPIDKPLPETDAPEFQAVRTITTFLPEDTILIPRGCLDPGPDARRLLVTVEITPKFDAYGVGLQEWLPAGWRVTQIKGDGFFYHRSRTEWIYPKRVAAGETIKLAYQVEAASTLPEGLDCQQGCCGDEVKLVGTVSSALGCDKYEVTGENTVHIWQCLPVMLAISRWDVSDDRLDVTLSDNISFPQVQRAVAFWQQSEPVPFTCGYTVGYETLKAIVAHWLKDIPVTEELPEATHGPTAPGNAADNSYEWFCQMKERQPASDWVGESTIPAVVDAGPDRVITCAEPVVTLKASVSGGKPPYSFVWKDSTGRVVGTTQEIQVDRPGTYTVTVSACHGCAGSDSVTVTQDITPPEVKITADQPALNCAVTVVKLLAQATGGTQPYSYQWTDSAGKSLGTSEAITVSDPGTYTVVVTGANGCSGSDEISITQDIAPPLVDAGPTQTLSCTVKSVSLTPTVTGGTPPYTYQWSGPDGKIIVSEADTGEITVDQPGVYTLTVTGANGCSASDTATVAEDFAAPVLDAGPDKFLTCAEQKAYLHVDISGGHPPYSIVWTDDCGNEIGTTADITVELPGVYTVTVTGANGCSASDTVKVIEAIDPPQVDAGPDRVLTCDVTKVTLDATVTGGTPPYTYAWRDACGRIVGNTEDITVSAPNTYTLTVTGADGCMASDSVVVTKE